MTDAIAADDQALLESQIKSVRDCLEEEKILEWLYGRATREVGCINCFDYGQSWIEKYILEATGIHVAITNLAILCDDTTTHICGWIYDSDRPDSVPALEDIAEWLEDALDWAAGNDDSSTNDVNQMVTGQDVLEWIAEH